MNSPGSPSPLERPCPLCERRVKLRGVQIEHELPICDELKEAPYPAAFAELVAELAVTKGQN